MDPRLIALFDRVRESCSFGEDFVFDDVNRVNVDGENALHWAARADDLEAARLLSEAEIQVNQLEREIQRLRALVK